MRSIDSNPSSRTQMIAERIRIMFSGFRKDDFVDPDRSILQIGKTLERYSDEVIIAVTSPETGLQTRLSFAPVLSEIIKACDYEAAKIEQRRQWAQTRTRPITPSPADDRPGRRANLLIHHDAPRYQAALEWSQTA